MLRHETRPHPGTQGVAIRLLARSPPKFRITSWPYLNPCNGRSIRSLATIRLLTGRASLVYRRRHRIRCRGLPKHYRGSESLALVGGPGQQGSGAVGLALTPKTGPAEMRILWDDHRGEEGPFLEKFPVRDLWRLRDRVVRPGRQAQGEGHKSNHREPCAVDESQRVREVVPSKHTGRDSRACGACGHCGGHDRERSAYVLAGSSRGLREQAPRFRSALPGRIYRQGATAGAIRGHADSPA